MATKTLRPTSGSGSNWNNIANAYDTSTGTEATVSVKSTNYSSRTATFNFDTSEIPSNATINSAILTINCMGSSNNRITLYADINGDSSSRVINSKCSNMASDTTADVASYMSNLNSIELTGYTSSSSRSYTLSIYDIYIDVNYTESTSGGGTTEKNILHINSNNDWGYVVETITGQTYIGTSITIEKNYLEDIEVIVYPNEGYVIANVYDNQFGDDPGPFTQYPYGIQGAITGSSGTESTIVVTYEKEESEEPKPTYTVTFVDWNGTVLKTETVEEGSSATAPANPTRDGYTFTGWDKSFTNITSNLTVTAQYEKNSSGGGSTDHLVAKYVATDSGTRPIFNDGYACSITETESNGMWTVEITSKNDFSSISFFNTSNVSKLYTIESLAITNAVTSTSKMFSGCIQLYELTDIADWDMSNVTDTSYMFNNTNISQFGSFANWNTNKITDVSYMFSACGFISSIDLHDFNTTNVSKMEGLLANNSYISTVNLDNFVTKNTTNVDSMLYGCSYLQSLSINNWDLSGVQTINNFYNGTTLNNVSMKNSDSNSVNKIIDILPTKTAASPGTLDIDGVDNLSQVNIETAQAKYWTVTGSEGESEPDIINLFPSFIDNAWMYNDWETTVISKEHYNITIKFDNYSDEGYYYYLPSSLYGETFVFGCESISENTEFVIRNSVTWETYAILDSNNHEVAITIPSDSSSLCLNYYCNSEADLNQQHCATGMYIYLGSGGNSGGEPEEFVANISIGNITLNQLYIGEQEIKYIYIGSILIYGSKEGETASKFVIGYVPIENEDTTLASNSVIVTNTTELTNALDNLSVGQTVYLRSGDYNIGECWIGQSGTSDNPIVIRNYPNEKPILKGGSLNIDNNLSYITIKGLTMTDVNLTGNDVWGKAIFIGAGNSYITIEDNEFYNLTSEGGTNIESGIQAIYVCGDANESNTPMISNCIIRNNYIHDCATGWSEAIMLEGNVTNCQIYNNTIDNTGNIGIDVAGNYSWTGTVGSVENQARNINIYNNLIKNCSSEYATSAGIYSDGARDITINHNIVYNCQCGIELGAEERGATVENFYVHNNLTVNCGRTLGVGGYQSTSATHQNTFVYNNTFIGGDWYADDNAMVAIYRTTNFQAYNNIFYAQSGNGLIENENGTITFDYNCWYQSGLSSLPNGEGANSFVGNPQFVNYTNTLDGDYTLQSNSICLNKGSYNATYCGTFDLKGNQRVNDVIDIGCYENI